MARNQPLTPELFGKALDRLIGMVVEAKAHMKIGLGLGQTLKGDPAIAQVAPIFWYMSLTSHLDVAQLIAFKLFDKNHGTLSIYYLLKHAENLKGAFLNAIPSQVEAILRVANGQITGLLTSPLQQIYLKRNRMLAHFDRTIISDPEKVEAEVKVTFSELNIIFNVAGSVLNEVSVRFRDVSASYDMVGSEDYKAAIDLITEGKCAQIRAYEAESDPWGGLRPNKCN